jgi:hypothetical protein
VAKAKEEPSKNDEGKERLTWNSVEIRETCFDISLS